MDIITAKYGLHRSPQWEARAHAHLLLQPQCLVCGRADVKRNVHHKYPFHFVVAVGRPDLELAEANLFTLCVEHEQEHHLLIGHLGCFESYNPDLEHFVALSRGLLASQIKGMREYQDAVCLRPAPLFEMNGRDKEALKRTLDRLMPAVV